MLKSKLYTLFSVLMHVGAASNYNNTHLTATETVIATAQNIDGI